MDEQTTKNSQGKLQQYIESRLWKSKLRGARWKISTTKMVEEIETHYLGGKKLKTDSSQMKTILEYIAAARHRCDSRWSTLVKNSAEWAAILETDQNTMLDLVREGLIATLHDVKRTRHVLEMLGHLPPLPHD